MGSGPPEHDYGLDRQQSASPFRLQFRLFAGADDADTGDVEGRARLCRQGTGSRRSGIGQPALVVQDTDRHTGLGVEHQHHAEYDGLAGRAATAFSSSKESRMGNVG